MIATRESIRPVVRVGGLTWHKVSTWLSLACPLVLSALLNFWNLSQNGYSNIYYSVAVQSMLQNWHNFFFGSYDAGGFITVDKPPVALWMQAISAKIFGFSSLSILLPEALVGVACVGLVYFLVKRIFGTLAAFVAALAMAITPVAVAVERGNNTDTWLMFFLLLAAWAITLATEKARLPMLLLSIALVGVAFNTKMLAAFIVLPTFYLLYMVAAPARWWKRLIHLGLATIVLLFVSLSWAVAVDLTPADQRPWIGGSQANSVLDLALNYNGLGRVTGDEGNGMGGGGGAPQGQGTFQPRDDGTRAQGGFTPPTGGTQAQGDFTFPGDGSNSSGVPSGTQPSSGNQGGLGGNFGGGNSGSGMFGAGVAGPLRLFGSELASQWSWLFPVALLGGLATLFTLRRRLTLEPKAQALLLWGGWLATYGVVFSIAEGIFHTYYLIMLAPAVAALAGIGIASLWKLYRNGRWTAWLLPLTLVATAVWQVKVLNDYGYEQWNAWLVPVIVAATVVVVVPLLATRLFTVRIWRRVSPALVTVALLALLITPFAWSATTTQAAGNGTMPTAGPSNLGSGFGGNGGAQMGQTGMGGESANSSLISYLEENNDGYFYLVAVSSANQASSIALETGEPVLAMGGFTGSDPAMTVEKLQSLIANKQVKYIMLGDMLGGSTSSVSSWVQSSCTAVDSSQAGTSQLYSCAAN